jgi:hypothetical protein
VGFYNGMQDRGHQVDMPPQPGRGVPPCPVVCFQFLFLETGAYRPKSGQTRCLPPCKGQQGYTSRESGEREIFLIFLKNGMFFEISPPSLRNQKPFLKFHRPACGTKNPKPLAQSPKPLTRSRPTKQRLPVSEIKIMCITE